jgi:hypothetical protein
VLRGSSPELFQRHVRSAIQELGGSPSEERLLFIKSWNEWAEGNHMEPDLVHGHGYLQALKAELEIHDSEKRILRGSQMCEAASLMNA